MVDDTILREILSTLRQSDAKFALEGHSVSMLIGEVRDSIRGTSEPTLRATILALQTQIHDDLTELRLTLTGDAGRSRGTINRGVEGGRSNDAALQLIATMLNRIDNRIDNKNRSQDGLSGIGIQSQSFTHQYRSIQNLIQDTDFRNKTFLQKIHVFVDEFIGLNTTVHRRFSTTQQDAIHGMTGLTTGTEALFSVFQRLGAFIKTNIIERYTGYMANRSGGLSATQYMTDDFYRIIKTLTGNREEIGYGFKDTQESVKHSLAEGVASPNLMYGKNLEQMSVMYKQTIDALEKSGANPRGFGSPDQLMKMIDVIQEQQKNAGVFKDMRAAESQSTLRTQLQYMKDIAKYTNMSADELIKLTKANSQEVTDLEAVGSLTKEQGDNLLQSLGQFKAMGKEGEFAAEWVKKYAASSMDTGKFMANHGEEVSKYQGATQGQFLPWLERTAQVATEKGSFGERQKAWGEAATQAGSSLNLGGMAGLQEKFAPGYSKVAGGIQSLEKYSQVPLPEVSKEPDKVQDVFTRFEDVTKQFPMFSGAIGTFVGAVGTFAGTLAGFAVAAQMGMFGRGAGSGGLLSGVGGMVSRAARIGVPVIGGTVDTATRLMSGEPTSQAVGAGIGSTGGAMIGAGLGSLIAPGIGTAIGMAAGGYIGDIVGSKIGQFMGEMAAPAAHETASSSTAPAVAPPENMVGPNGPEVSDGARTSYQDSHLSMLSQLVAANEQGNSLLGSMFGQLTRQTELAERDSGSAGSVGYGGSGLSARTSAVAKTGRPDASTPYVGQGG